MWKTIHQAHNYQVSRRGEVRNKSTRRIRTLTITASGYPMVMLWDGNKKKGLKVHRLVALAFIPNPNNKPEVNHKDLDKTNNQVDNLEWATRKENLDHAKAHGVNVANGSPKNLERRAKIQAYTAEGKSPTEIGLLLNMDSAGVCHYLKRLYSGPQK